MAAADDAVERVVICTPDKDLGQCVGGKVWQWDRRQDKWFDAAGVRERLGVPAGVDPRPARAGGRRRRRVPGPARAGAPSRPPPCSTAGATSRTSPPTRSTWDAGVRGAAKLNATLREQFELALLFRRIATVETDADVGAVADWEWRGPTAELAATATALGDDRLVARAEKLGRQARQRRPRRSWGGP